MLADMHERKGVKRRGYHNSFDNILKLWKTPFLVEINHRWLIIVYSLS
eukprot:UN14392